eukprot:gene26880-33044_t
MSFSQCVDDVFEDRHDAAENKESSIAKDIRELKHYVKVPDLAAPTHKHANFSSFLKTEMMNTAEFRTVTSCKYQGRIYEFVNTKNSVDKLSHIILEHPDAGDFVECMSDSEDAPADDGSFPWFKEHGDYTAGSEFWYHVAELAASAPAVGMQRTGSSSAKYAHEVQALRGELAHTKVDFEEKLGFLTAELVAENATMRASEPASAAPEVAKLRAISRAQLDQLDTQAILAVNAPMTQEDAFDLAVYRKLVQRRFIRVGTQG